MGSDMMDSECEIVQQWLLQSSTEKVQEAGKIPDLQKDIVAMIHWADWMYAMKTNDCPTIETMISIYIPSLDFQKHSLQLLFSYCIGSMK